MQNLQTYNQAEINVQSKIPRTMQKIEFDKFDTINMGELGIGCALEVLPNQFLKLNMKMLARTASALIKPIMSNIYCQVACFFVPNRLTDDHWEEIMGENKQGPWITNKTEYEVPYITAPAGGWQKGTVADKLGIRTKTEGLKINSHYPKGYCQIWNDFYRDENINNYTHITKDSTNLQGSNGDNYVTDPEKGGKLLKVCKKHDMFTSLVRAPQKGPDVLLPLGNSAPVTTSFTQNNPTLAPLYWKGANGNDVSNDNETARVPYLNKITANGKAVYTTLNATTTMTLDEGGFLAPSNLYADLQKATAASVNELRMAIALQQLYELDTMGTRYNELIYNHYGCRTGDARLQRAEYLGGKDIPINVAQIIQTSATNDVSAQGNLAGISQTYDEDELFSHNFVEHGILYVLLAFKQEHAYQQGLNAKFSRFKRTDFYDPIFANIGMQPIFNREIYATGTAVDDQVIGYNEAWANYRYHPNEVCGQFRSDEEGTLDMYHLADDFAETPTLSDEFIFETKDNLDRCLAVPSSQQDQFLYQLHFDFTTILPMPVHSLPGLKRL